MNLPRRKIQLIFTLGTGDFGLGTGNTLTIDGLRCSVRITNVVGGSANNADLRVYGLTLDQMNRLSTLQRLYTLDRQNILTIMAGDDVNGMYIAYKGEIALGWIDANGSPDIAYDCTCIGGYSGALAPTPAVSYPGTADAAIIAKNIAAAMGVDFINSGVSVILSQPALNGTAVQQFQSLKQQANIDGTIENGVMAIWPKNGARDGAIPLISKDTGMIGYPTFDGVGIGVRTIYNPQLKQGQQVKVQSELAVASGTFNIFSLSHALDAETPGGLWETSFTGRTSGG